MTHKKRIMGLVEEKQRPMQAASIHHYLQEHITIEALRVVLTVCEQQGALSSIKFSGTPKFYCKPEWVKDGKLIGNEEFDPYWNKKVKIK